jgi:hypothetical protein
MRKTTTNTKIYFSILKQDEKNHNKDRNLLLNPRTGREKTTFYFKMRCRPKREKPLSNSNSK